MTPINLLYMLWGTVQKKNLWQKSYVRHHCCQSKMATVSNNTEIFVYKSSRSCRIDFLDLFIAVNIRTRM